MKNKAALSSRSRSEILGAIASIPRAVQGKICEMHKTLAGGKTATYYNLQYWSQGRNHSVHIPREKLDEFREAVEGGMKLRSLVTELGESDMQDKWRLMRHRDRNTCHCINKAAHPWKTDYFEA